MVIDNNCIDKYVTFHKPTHVIIEALWVVPSKFRELARLHPKVKWIVRVHSKPAFLASEGVAVGWIAEYLDMADEGIKIEVAFNNKDALEDFDHSIQRESIVYLPNICESDTNICQNAELVKRHKEDEEVHIGCFGALRVLKNHLHQAMMAIRYANENGLSLYFHINKSEHESVEADPVLKNLRSLFDESEHVLVEHMWTDHKEFLHLVSKMDFGLQLSFSETFNIVAADFVHCKVPIVVSDEIDWVFPLFRVDAGNSTEIINTMKIVHKFNVNKVLDLNAIWLNKHNRKALDVWKDYLVG